MGKEDDVERLRQKLEGHDKGGDLGTVVGVSRRKLADSAFRSVASGRFLKVKFLLDNGVSPNTRNDAGQSLLVAALHIRDEDKRRRMVTYLLSRGVGCSGRDDKGRDVLCWTCILGLPVQLQQICTAAIGDVDLHRQDKEGMTPLHHAVHHGHLDIVRILVAMMTRFRLSVDVSDVHGLTPYLYARRLGQYAIANILVNDGRASRKQFDTQNFHSADEWALIGAEERKEHERNAKQRQLALYKIRGRLPPMQHRLVVPRIRLNGEHDDEDDEDEQDTSGNVTSRSMDTAMTLLRYHPDARLVSQRNSIVESHAESFDNHHNHHHHHHHHHKGTAQASIPSIMDILADQRCPSYRPQAKLPPVAPTNRRLLGNKGKMSTLAILLQGKGGVRGVGGGGADMISAAAVAAVNRRKSVAPR